MGVTRKTEPIGIIANENKPLNPTRSDIINEWVLPYWPMCPIYGKWTELGASEIGRPDIAPVPTAEMRAKMSSWASTLMMPASGSGWATAKPWECFASGVVCFFHPGYDTTDSILADAPPALHKFLRPTEPDQFRQFVDMVWEEPTVLERILAMQRRHYDETAVRTEHGLHLIEQRLNLLPTVPLEMLTP